METILDEENTTPCVFCKSPQIDQINLGPIYYRDGTACHYYCMLFSAALKQTGSDEEGILGFLKDDIFKEVRRAARLRCAYCRNYGASVGCCKKKCNKAFHFTCGLANGANFQFFGQYEAFCKSHWKPQNIVVKYKDWKCLICHDRVTHSGEPIMTNCCSSTVFHKQCLKKMALNAGYFFKCALCNATKVFTDEMRRLGIFVPEQDASWEREPNAFQELLYQYNRCDAEICECSKGREYNAAKGGFILARCRICGAAGVHRQCGKLRTVANWACGLCLNVEIKTKEERKRTEKLNKTLPVPVPVANNSHATARAKPVEVDLRNVIISPSCFNYFPYTQEKMAEFQKLAEEKQKTDPKKKLRLVVPDHRNYVIQANFVDWLGGYIKKSIGVPQPRGIKRPAPAVEPPLNLNQSEDNDLATAEENYVPVFKKPALPKQRKPKKYKTSKWNRGVLSKQRKGAVTKKNLITGIDAKKEPEIETVASTMQLTDDLRQNGQLQENDSEIQEIVEETKKSNSFPPNKRKVFELGYKMMAIGLTSEFLVQSNVEVPSGDHMPANETEEIDRSALRPLGTFQVNVGKQDAQSADVDSMNFNGIVDEDQLDNSRLKNKMHGEETEDGILRQDSPLRDVIMEHSYCKTEGEKSDLLGKCESTAQTQIEDSTRKIIKKESPEYIVDNCENFNKAVVP